MKMRFYKKYLPMLAVFVLLAGCAEQPKREVWSILLDGKSTLMDQRGVAVWQGDGEAVRNEWGNFVVTDWENEKPLQSIISHDGTVLVQGNEGEQILQLGEKLIAVQPEGEQWSLSTEDKTYHFDRADIQPDGKLLLCGLSEGGSALLDANGKELSRFSADFLWAASGLEDWYQSGDLLMDSTGVVRYSGVQRMVGQGRVLLRKDDGYQVIQADSGKQLYSGPKNWRVYLDNLQLEQQDGGIFFQAEDRQYQADFLNSWPYSGEPVYYMAQGAEVQALWNAQGERLFLRPAADWMEIIAPDRIACLEQQTLKMLDEKAQPLWEKEGYDYVWTVKCGEETLLCANRTQQPTIDIFSAEGESLLENLEVVYEITEKGVSAQKDGKTGIIDWKGNWLCRWEYKNSALLLRGAVFVPKPSKGAG